MLVVSKARFATTLIICFLGMLFAFPSMVDQATYDKLPGFLRHTVNLGLELRGGSHLQLEVDLASVIRERQESIVDEARKQLRKQNIRYKKISVQSRDGESLITIALQDEQSVSSVKKILTKIENELDIETQGENVVAKLTKKYIDEFSKRIVGESIEVIRHRIDETGTKEPTI